MAGYDGFKAFVDAVALDLGGRKHVRTAVATACAEALQVAVETRLGTGRHSLPTHVGWTLAEGRDFDEAVKAAGRTSLRMSSLEPVRRSEWGGAALVQREGIVRLEGRDHAIVVAMVGGTIPTRDRYGDKAGETTHVFLTDMGKLALYGTTLPPSQKPSSRNAKSAGGADKALVGLVQDFFRVAFEGVDPEAGPKP